LGEPDAGVALGLAERPAGALEPRLERLLARWRTLSTHHHLCGSLAGITDTYPAASVPESSSRSGLSALQGDGSQEGWTVESFLVSARPHEPCHGLPFAQALPHFVIQVRLFGQHCWKVSFSELGCRPELLPAQSYHLDLESDEETFVEWNSRRMSG